MGAYGGTRGAGVAYEGHSLYPYSIQGSAGFSIEPPSQQNGFSNCFSGLSGFEYIEAHDGDASEDFEGSLSGALVSSGTGLGVAAPHPAHSNLYVKNIPEDVTEEQLEALFSVYGDVDSCRLVRNLKTGASRGYGFVRYATVQQAMMAIAALNGHVTAAGGQRLEVKFADSDAGPKNPKQPPGSTPSDNLYVRNLPPSWGEVDLVSLFTPFGEVVETRLLNAGSNEYGIRGMGALVRLATVDQATSAIEGINGCSVPGCSLPLMVRYADTAEDKARRHQRQLRGPRYTPYPPGSHELSNGGNAPNSPKLTSTNSLPAGFTGFNSAGIPDTPQSPTFSAAVSQNGMETGVGAEAGVWPQGMGSYGWGLDAMGGLNGSGVTSLYVKNLPPEADKLYLYEKFAIYGGIASVKVLLDEATGACKGVGFINYVDPNAAMEAIHAMNGLKVGDKQLHVSLQTHRPGSRGGHTGGYFPAALH